MRKSVLVGLSALAIVGLVSFTTPATAQGVTSTPLDVTCGPAFFPTYCVVDMSGDGNTILFQDRIWTASGGFQTIGGPPEGFVTTALSDDGSTVVGDVFLTEGPLGPRFEAAVWLGGDQWRPLGGLPGASPCGSNFTSAFDVSGDGSKVAGLAWVGLPCRDAHAFAWTEETGMVDLGAIVEGRASRVNAVSADGEVLAGWSDSSFGERRAASWDHVAPPAWLVPDGSPIFAGEATGINSDGSVMVGGAYEELAPPSGKRPRIYEPWIWRAETGVVPLGTVKGLRGDIIDGQHYARDVSDDGGVVVGQDTLYNLGEQWAFVWTAQDGINPLQDYVRARTDPATKAKICSAQRSPLRPCQNWDFWNTAAVSNDGKTIVGTGRNPAGLWEAFKITLP